MNAAFFSNTLGALVADRRRVLGLSQRDLADRICLVSGRTTITRHELSRYERGLRLTGGAMVAVLAESLGVPVAVLAYESDTWPDAPGEPTPRRVTSATRAPHTW